MGKRDWHWRSPESSSWMWTVPPLMERRSLRPHLGIGGEIRIFLPQGVMWGACFIVLVLSSLIVTVVSQGATDFISIHCGGLNGFKDTRNIEWSTDEDYLDSIEVLRKMSVAVPATMTLDEKTKERLANAELVKTAMVFRPGVEGLSPSKYCYVVQVQNGTDYLVRVVFPSSNLTARDPNIDLTSFRYITRFYFTVDSTFISTIDLDPVAPKTVELFVTPLDRTMYICFVPLEDRSSMPAVSTIELRPLLDSLYQQDRTTSSSGSDINPKKVAPGNTGRRASYLLTVSRLNFGGNTSAPPIRYPLDHYDRLWYPAGSNDTNQPTSFKTRTTTEFPTSSSDSFPQNWDFPLAVWQTAWEGRDSNVNLSFKFNLTAAGGGGSRPTIATYYFSLAIFDMDAGPEPVPEQFRKEDIYLDDGGSKRLWQEVRLDFSGSAEVYSNAKQTFSSKSPSVVITPRSSLPTMINAFELLGEFEAETVRTLLDEDKTIRNFTSSLDLQLDPFLDTVGDPCLPVPWNWLVCSIESPPRIIQINITSIGAKGTLPGKFDTLDRLTALDLSNNMFWGPLPQTLASIRTLRILNLANNELSGDLPVFKKDTLLNLQILSLRNNRFTGNLSSLFLALGSESSVSRIDLSNNSFTGTLPQELGQLQKLQELDLSWNNLSMSAGVEVIGKMINFSRQLKTLNLRHNNFSGVVPGDIWTSTSLETVDLSNNRFDTVDLTSWCSGSLIQKGLDFNALKQKVNLNKNAINKVIFPCQDQLNKIRKPRPEDTVDWVQSSNGFILLTDNPYCTGVGKNDPNLALRYVCRSNQFSNFWDVDRANKEVVIIASVISGVLVLLMACIVLVVLRKTWKRMKELREIQEALAKEDVRPPFFKYDELKTAAGDFSETNKLGVGAFGAVYKAVLKDQTVAVKVLEPTDQNITDFLKEMVLITGIKHKHLIQLKGCCVRDRKRLLVYEYAENKDLADALWGPERTYGLNWEQRFKICVGVAKGLCYLHEELQPRIIHRDIKAQNILLDNNWDAKIADFGLALPIQERAGGSSSTLLATRIGGTLGYFSPEYATTGKVTEKLDVFSYGVLVLEILAGRKCIDLSLTNNPDQIYLKDWTFKKYSEGKVLDIVEKGVLDTVSPEEILPVIKTALSCVHENYEKRPSMSQVVNMLLGISPDDVATDIIGQLKEQERMYQGLFDAAFKGEGSTDQNRALLQNSSNNPGSVIRLSVTKPR
ncbi:hypothetical protein R1sor_002467 [Riccia sorocarpa]|uniref:non-specific serine/threonine protein kinase n=1 Tax=Riccia sorocarpa TaxID=122646 RepID=A0ABD3H2C5_9MARC